MKRIFIILSYLTFIYCSGVLAQEKNFKSNAQDNNIIPDSVLISTKYRTGMEVGTSFMSNLRKGYGFETYFSPNLSYFPSNSLKLDFSATLSSVNYHNMTLFDYYNMSHVVSGMGNYFGVSGQGTYRINDKFYINSGGFAEKLPDFGPVENRFENKINYGGSVLVGYKFSDKVSIQAGFGVQRFNDPWNVNPFMNNHGFMP